MYVTISFSLYNVYNYLLYFIRQGQVNNGLNYFPVQPFFNTAITCFSIYTVHRN